LDVAAAPCGSTIRTPGRAVTALREAHVLSISHLAGPKDNPLAANFWNFRVSGGRQEADSIEIRPFHRIILHAAAFLLHNEYCMRIPLLVALGLLALTLGSGNAQTTGPTDSSRRVIRPAPVQSSSDAQDAKNSSLEANYQLRLKGIADKNTFLDISILGAGKTFSIVTAEDESTSFQGTITPEGEHFLVTYNIALLHKVQMGTGANEYSYKQAIIAGTVKLTPGKAMRIAEVNGKIYSLEIRPADSPEK
jgi:hypothetical protein